MGTQWAGMGRSLMELPDFRESILRSDTALKDTGLVVSRLLMAADDSTFEDTVHAFVGLAAIQVVLGFHSFKFSATHSLHAVSVTPTFSLVFSDRSDRPACQAGSAA